MYDVICLTSAVLWYKAIAAMFSIILYTNTHTPTLLHTLTYAHNLSLLLMSEHFNMVFINFQSFRQCFEQESKTIIINHRLKNAHIKTMECDSGNVAKPHERATNFVRSSWNTVVEDVCVCILVCELCARSPSAERRAALIKLIFMDERNDTQKS